MQKLTRPATGLAALLALMFGATACGGSTQPPDGPGSPTADPSGTFPRLARVAVLVLENRSYRQVIGSPKAPYLNGLAQRYALATRYYAIGHPSLPNYVALTGGARNGIGTNCKQCDTEEPNLLNQLDAGDIDWRAYFEGLPKGDRLTNRTLRYNPHYNPFGYYERVSDPKKSRGDIVGFTRLRRDLARRRLPRFSWIAPDVFHDATTARLERPIAMRPSSSRACFAPSDPKESSTCCGTKARRVSTKVSAAGRGAAGWH